MALQYFLLFIDGAVLPAPHDLEVLRGWGDEAAHLRDDRLDKLVIIIQWAQLEFCFVSIWYIFRSTSVADLDPAGLEFDLVFILWSETDPVFTEYNF